MKTITILTPTYNRGETLPQCYESLKRQTDFDFEWIVVDDGSWDDTETLVAGWIEEDNQFPIYYYKKENGGKHTALNVGFEKADSCYTIILDSDDYLTDDAVAVVKTEWSGVAEDSSIGAVVFLIQQTDGTIPGGKFSEEKFVASSLRFQIKGDKTHVFRTQLLKEHPFPVFERENFIGEGIVWRRMGRTTNSLHINRPIYICEYREDGLSRAGRKLRIQNPQGGMLYHLELMKYHKKIKFRMKGCLLYTTYGFFTKKPLRNTIQESPMPAVTALMMPVGYALYRFWNHRYG